MNYDDNQQLIGKYVISPIDGKSYCRKNGQFLRHLRCNGFSNYQSFFESYFPNQIKICQFCNNKCSFDSHQMSYTSTCGNKSCTGKLISLIKRNRSEQQLDQFKIKYHKTMDQKSDQQVQAIIANRQRTWMKKYGYDHPWKAPGIRSKIVNTMQQKYNTQNYSTTLISDYSKQLLNCKEWLQHEHIIKQRPLYVIAKQLNVSDRTVGNYLHAHGIYTNRFQQSNQEKQMAQFLENNNISFIQNQKTLISPYEIDFFLPEFNIGIEMCGLYWHSEAQERLTKNYHYNKYISCKNKGILLLTIFEDEWNVNQQLIQRSILHKCGRVNNEKVYARNTIIEIVNYTTAKSFLIKNHIQGACSASIYLGIMSNGELIALGAFLRNSNETYTLTRYCTSKTVVGGFSKMLQYFIRKFSPKQILTFADNRWSNGNLYQCTGFNHDKDLPPDYQYIVNGKRVHKFNFRHKQLVKRLKNYDPVLSERDNCFNNGIYRVWDCGKRRYILSCS